MILMLIFSVPETSVTIVYMVPEGFCAGERAAPVLAVVRCVAESYSVIPITLFSRNSQHDHWKQIDGAGLDGMLICICMIPVRDLTMFIALNAMVLWAVYQGCLRSNGHAGPAISVRVKCHGAAIGHFWSTMNYKLVHVKFILSHGSGLIIQEKIQPHNYLLQGLHYKYSNSIVQFVMCLYYHFGLDMVGLLWSSYWAGHSRYCLHITTSCYSHCLHDPVLKTVYNAKSICRSCIPVPTCSSLFLAIQCVCHGATGSDVFASGLECAGGTRTYEFDDIHLNFWSSM